MEQLVEPNLNVPARYTRCLEYVQNAFDAPYSGPSATYAWNHTEYPHVDEPLPSGVYVLVWFTYWGTVDGVYDNWGHVLIYKDGTCYSSPYTEKNTHDVIGSISEVEQIYGCNYVGWSEDIAGLKVIGEIMNDPKAKVNRGDIINICRADGWEPDEKYLSVHDGQGWHDFMYDWYGQGVRTQSLKKKYGANPLTCTKDERSYLDLLKKVSK